MGANDRRVDADHPADQAGGVGIGQQSSENVIPGAVTAVAAVTLPQGLPRTELDRDITPGQPAPEPVDDPLHHSAVISERASWHPRRAMLETCG